MRKIYKKIEIGEKRIIKKFLLFPKTIENEWRWLEKAEWEEEFAIEYKTMGLNCRGMPYTVYNWVSRKWIN